MVCLDFLSDEIWLHSAWKPCACCNTPIILLRSTEKWTCAPSCVIHIDCIIVTHVLWYNFRLIAPLIGRKTMEIFICLHRPCSCPTMSYPLRMFPDIVTTHHYHLTRMKTCLKLSPSVDREHTRRHYYYTVYGTLVRYLTWYILLDVPHTPLSSRA